MTPQQCTHVDHIKQRVCSEIETKYRQGVKEHGGNLWEKGLMSLLAPQVRMEALDQIVYSHVMTDQLAKIKEICADNINAHNTVNSVNTGFHEILTILNGTIQAD